MTAPPKSPVACALCGETHKTVARALGCCLECIREHTDEALPLVQAARRVASSGGMDPAAPEQIEPPLPGAEEGLVAMGFYDDHPANCIASWQCPGTTGCGYPEHAVHQGLEQGCRNLAVFTAGCNFSCPFCQDWIHRTMQQTGSPRFTDEEILGWVDDRTTCVCFCGGTPDIQLEAVTRISRKLRRRYSDRVMRICAETNLTAPWERLLPFAELVHASGGGLNIGLKAGTRAVHRALTGATNDHVWRNIEKLSSRFGPGHPVPFIRASLLIVPGYVEEHEVRVVAWRLAALNPDLSLKLIAFLPRYRMTDLPAVEPAELAALAGVALECGVRRVSPEPRGTRRSGRFVR